MAYLTPEMLDKGTATDVQKAMAKDLRVAAGKLKGNAARFVVAGGVRLSDKKTVSLFVVVETDADAKEWQLKLKTVKPKHTGVGTCTVASKDSRVRIGIVKAAGAPVDLVIKTAQAALLDKKISVFDSKAADAEDSKAAQVAASGDEKGTESEGSEAQGEEGDR